MIKKDDSGFSLVELLIIVGVVVILGLVGWLVYSRQQNKSRLQTTNATGLVITRNNPLNQPGINNYTRNVSHESASKILNDIGKMKLAPSGPVDCPEDDGVNYTLKFTAPDLTAAASAAGCQEVIYGQQTYLSTTTFWQDIKQATHKAIDPNSDDCASYPDQLYCKDN